MMLKEYFSYLYSHTSKNSSKALDSLLEKNEDAALLDCGCWDGKSTMRFGAIIGTKNLHGIEIVKTKAREASKRGIKVKIADLNKRLPYKNNSFDTIIAYHVIEHLVKVRNFASELHRLLKPNGYVVIGTPNLASWHNVFALFMGLQPFSGPTIEPEHKSGIKFVTELNQTRLRKVFEKDNESLEHIKIMTTKALVSLLKSAGFRTEAVKGFGYYPLPPMLARPLSAIDRRHSHYIVIKARK